MPKEGLGTCKQKKTLNPSVEDKKEVLFRKVD